MPGVALHPFESDAPSLNGTVNLLDKFKILNRLLIGFDPSALLPADPPLRHDVDRVLGVAQDMQVFAREARGLGRFEHFEDGSELTEIVRPFWPSARIPAALVNDPRPACGSGVSERGAVCGCGDRHGVMLVEGAQVTASAKSRDEAGHA